MSEIKDTQERKRLVQYTEEKVNWKLWGPYLSERQWGTVREHYDISHGDAWKDFTYDQSLFRAYRWGEDGIAGISDDHQRLCFSVAFWNCDRDDPVKERLFGLSNPEGNNSEDVKEYYYYLDNTPTHSYMKYLYKYPHAPFPYQKLREENRNRARGSFEYELVDTKIFDNNKYFDVVVEYAKKDPDDILVKITVTNRAVEEKELVVIPTIWFRNIWSWGDDNKKPWLKRVDSSPGHAVIQGNAVLLDDRWLYCEGTDELLFTDNETNKSRFPSPGTNDTKYQKDGIDRYLRQGEHEAVNHDNEGTKAGVVYRLKMPGHGSKSLRLRLSNKQLDPFTDFDETFRDRQQEADEFYDAICVKDKELRDIQRQAFAGMLWNKQLYHYIVRRWLDGDDPHSSPPQRLGGKNDCWDHLYSKDVISMPDKWEYPWFAAWDLAFHTTTLAMIDPEFAKSQLLFLVMEWYQDPGGGLPGFEYDFGAVNPPVHAWAAWNVYQIEKKLYHTEDVEFLRRIFLKLNMNFTWWVNKTDQDDNNVFGGGFLGMDNIRIVDPRGGTIEQSDGTSWMAMYCLDMMVIAAELVNKGDTCFRDSLRKYFQHFLLISRALNCVGDLGLWDRDENFYFDVVRYKDRAPERLRAFSYTGLVPLLAIAKINVQATESESFLDLSKTLDWFLKHREDLSKNDEVNFYPPHAEEKVKDGRFELALSIVAGDRLPHIMEKMLHPDEFLSPFGIRSLSRRHLNEPYDFYGEKIVYSARESTTTIMGGNSNWRGPIWMPINYLIINALRKFHEYMDGSIEVPHAVAGSTVKQSMTLDKVADDLSQRLISIFKGEGGKRPVFAGLPFFDDDEHKGILFYEYFNGDDGAGLGASHQTGWSALVANLIAELGESGSS